MKKSLIIRAVLLAVSCIPFAFLAVHGDGISGSMLFYGVMVAGFSLLCWGAVQTHNLVILYIGDLFSFIASCAAAKLSGLEPMGYYFKPFTSHSLILIISVVVLIVHTLVLLLCKGQRTTKSK